MQRGGGAGPVAWISVDELLERVLLKVYRLWEHGAMAPVRSLLDEERLRLATVLRSLATSNVSQSEDAILLFLEAIAKLEPIATIGQEEFALLPEVKQGVLKARRPVLRIRGHKAKPTNLTPARMQGLLSMLEAVDPPTFAVGKLFFPGDLTALADLLETAMALLFSQWRLLALETRGAILRIVHTIRVGLVEENGHHLVTVRSIVETLHQFEAMPEVMQFARDAFLAGKVDVPPEEPFRFNAMAIVSDRLAEMIADPPPIHPSAPQEPAKPPVDVPRDRQPETQPPAEPEPPLPTNGKHEPEPVTPEPGEPVARRRWAGRAATAGDRTGPAHGRAATATGHGGARFLHRRALPAAGADGRRVAADRAADARALCPLAHGRAGGGAVW